MSLNPTEPPPSPRLADLSIEDVLLRAWSFAEKDRAFWVAQFWPLIARVEAAHHEGDVDGYAEEKLRRLVWLGWVWI
jgi:hypothetical protein